MYYLNKNESVKVEDFNSFLKKYQKSGYISTISKYKLKDLGILPDVFSKLESKVKDVMSFIRDNDRDIFFDYFQEIRDIYPQITEYFHFKVGVKPFSDNRHVSSLDDFGFIVSLDNSGIPSFRGEAIDSDINVISNIVDRIEFNRLEKIKKYQDSYNKSVEKRPGAYDWWSKYKLIELSADYIKKCEIYPVIGLKIFLNTDDYDDFLYTDEEYQDFSKRKIESNRQIVRNIEDNLKIFLPSYLSTIGYSSNFEIKKSGNGIFSWYDGGDIVGIDIKINLNK
jgi:hypothetical protein